MRFEAIYGKFHKKFVKIIIDNPNDKREYEYFEIIKNIVTRTEFMPFIKGTFDKNITYSYLLKECFIPFNLWFDVKDKLSQVIHDKSLLKLTFPNNDKHKFFNIELNRKNIDDFVETLTFPEYINLFSENYDYQIESTYRAIKFKSSKLQLPTGAGKTLITYLICKYLIDNKLVDKILFIINRKTLISQTGKEFDAWENLQEYKTLKVSTIFSGMKAQADSNIIIGTYQTISNYDKEYFDDFQCLIIDEAHTAKAYSIRNEIYNKCTNTEYTIALSATFPEWKTLDYLHITAMFGPTIFTKTIKETVESGNIVPVDINFVNLRYNDETIKELNDLKESFENPEYIDLYNAEVRFFQSNQFKTDTIYDIIKNNNNNFLILCNTVDYLKFLGDYLQTKFSDEKSIYLIHGNIPLQERENIFKEFEQRTVNNILIATYGTMSTGVNLKKIFNMILLETGKSQVKILQSIGRGVRLSDGKDRLQVYDIVDYVKNSFSYRQALTRLKLYKKVEYKIHTLTYEQKRI